MELEQKFLVSREDAVQGVLTLADRLGWAATQEADCQMRDEYWDTGDNALERRGDSLRIRDCKGKTLFTYKTGMIAENGLFFRGETEVPTGENPQVQLIQKGLEPKLTVENIRRRWLLCRDDVRVELALDHVTYQGSGKSVGQELQMELELKSAAGEAALKNLVSVTEKEYHFTAMRQSKYQRGMHLTGQTE